MEARFCRDVFWVCVRYYSKPNTEVGQAALRLRANPRHPGWRADLELVIAKVFEVNAFGFYSSSLRAQGAAIRLTESLKKVGAA